MKLTQTIIDKATYQGTARTMPDGKVVGAAMSCGMTSSGDWACGSSRAGVRASCSSTGRARGSA